MKNLKYLLALFLLLGSLSCSKFIKPCKIELHGIKIESMSFTNTNIRVNTFVTNPNRFSVNIVALSYTIFIENQLAGHGEIQSGFNIPSKNKVEVAFPLEVNNLKITQSLIIFIKKGSVNCQTKGIIDLKAWIGKKRFPFDVRRSISTKDIYKKSR